MTNIFRVLLAKKQEQLEFKLEKLLGFRNMQEKLENTIYLQRCIQ